jgi:hypothetical protein
MNLLTIDRNELMNTLNEKNAALEILAQEITEIHRLLAEKDRLEALNAQFGNISEEDIKQIRDAQILSAQGVQSEEVVKYN